MKLTKDALMTAFEQMLSQFPEAVEDETLDAEMEEEGEMPMKKGKPGLADYMQKMA